MDFTYPSAVVRARLSSLRQAIAFHVMPPDRQLLVSDALPFDDKAQACFVARVREARSYLEFGSGSSTLHVAGKGKPLVSIESDRQFLDAVRERITHLGAEGSTGSDAILLHADIGPTGPWGKPVFRSFTRPGKWSNYPHHPWRILGKDYFADTILVDGRFRVACALAVIFYQGDEPWTMLVDDYDKRPHYGEIERYAQLVKMHGRMAEFKPMVGIDKAVVAEALGKFSSDWR